MSPKHSGDTSFRHASPQAVEAIEFTRRRRLMTWLNLVVMTLLLLGVVVVINLIAREHPRRFNWTADRIEELSAEGRSRLRAVDREFNIAINVFDYGGLEKDRTLAHAWGLVASLTKEFERINPKIKVTVLEDQRTTPTWLNEFGLRQPNMIYLYCRSLDGRVNKRMIDIRELYTGDRASGEISDFRAEVRLVSAITTMLSTERKIVYIVEGHEEMRALDQGPEGASLLLDVLRERDNVDFRRLMPGQLRDVPRDADALFIPGPRRDLPPEELEGLRDYLAAGGRVLASVEPISVTPQYVRFLAAWGAEVQSDAPVIHDHASNVAPNAPWIPRIRSLGRHPINAEKLAGDPYVDVPIATAVKPVPPPDRKLAVTPLLRTTGKERCFMDLNRDNRMNSDEPRGPFDVLVAIEGERVAKPRRPGRVVPKMLVWGSTKVFSNYFNVPDPSGAQYFLANWRWLLDIEQVQADPGSKKPTTQKPLVLSEGALSQIQWVCIGLPLIGVVLGIFAWWFRRK